MLIKNKLSELVNSFIQNIYTNKFIIKDESFIIENVLDIEENKFICLLSNGEQLVNQMINTNKFINGTDIFKLYDTFGIPLDLIKDLISKHNINLDMNGFNLEMEKQIKRSKKKDISISLKQNIKDEIKTIFVGYEQLSIHSKIIKIVIGNDIYNQISCGSEGIIITSDTCFYSEKGGQAGDNGIIKNAENIFLVNDTKELNGVILHYGKMLSGVLKYNDSVTMTVNDENRVYTSINHSATHLLHAALRKILGNHVKQAGSFINNKYLRFDFTHFKSLSSNEILKIDPIAFIVMNSVRDLKGGMIKKRQF